MIHKSMIKKHQKMLMIQTHLRVKPIRRQKIIKINKEIRKIT